MLRTILLRSRLGLRKGFNNNKFISNSNSNCSTKSFGLDSISNETNIFKVGNQIQNNSNEISTMKSKLFNDSTFFQNNFQMRSTSKNNKIMNKNKIDFSIIQSNQFSTTTITTKTMNPRTKNLRTTTESETDTDTTNTNDLENLSTIPHSSQTQTSTSTSNQTQEPISFEEFDKEMKSIIQQIKEIDPKSSNFKRLGIALSGGPDSAALVLLTKEWIEKTGKKIELFCFHVVSFFLTKKIIFE